MTEQLDLFKKTKPDRPPFRHQYRELYKKYFQDLKVGDLPEPYNGTDIVRYVGIATSCLHPECEVQRDYDTEPLWWYKGKVLCQEHWIIVFTKKLSAQVRNAHKNDPKIYKDENLRKELEKTTKHNKSLQTQNKNLKEKEQQLAKEKEQLEQEKLEKEQILAEARTFMEAGDVDAAKKVLEKLK